MGLFAEKAKVMSALGAFLGLSICLLKRQAKELPDVSSKMEATLLDIELGFPQGAFNRRWLRTMHLIQPGPYTRKFP